MTENHSVTALLQQLEGDQSAAAQELWDRFIHRLIATADKRLRHLPRRMVDGEDIAISAFGSFLKGAQDGRFRQLKNRDDLWQVLAMLAERKAIRTLRRELAAKRGGGQVRGESVFEKMLGESAAAGGLDQMGDPAPEIVEQFTHEVRDLLDSLDDELLRKIALLKLEGYTNQEVADRLQLALRSIERKLQLIREKWKATEGA